MSLHNRVQDGNFADTNNKKGKMQYTDIAVILPKVFQKAVIFNRLSGASRAMKSCLSCKLIQCSGDFGPAISFP